MDAHNVFKYPHNAVFHERFFETRTDIINVICGGVGIRSRATTGLTKQEVSTLIGLLSRVRDNLTGS